MFVLYLDAYHLGDPLFLTGLARDARARFDAGGSGFVIVHGTGEAGERAVEALGIEPARESGALVPPTPEAARAAERAGRDLLRQVVHELSEAGVHAVRVTGADRGLVRADGSIGKASWVGDLARQRAVPVVLSLAPEASGEVGSGAPGGAPDVREVDPAGLSGRLAAAIGAEAVVALGTPLAGDGTLSAEAADGAVPDSDALRRIALGGVGVRVARRAALRAPGVPGREVTSSPDGEPA